MDSLDHMTARDQFQQQSVSYNRLVSVQSFDHPDPLAELGAGVGPPAAKDLGKAIAGPVRPCTAGIQRRELPENVDALVQVVRRPGKSLQRPHDGDVWRR